MSSSQWRWLVGGIAFLLVIWVRLLHEKRKDIKKMSDAELIDHLQHEWHYGVGFDPMMSFSGFNLDPSTLELANRMSTRNEIHDSETFNEIVRRGASIVPSLVSCISDGRPTEIVIRRIFKPLGASFLSDEYEARHDRDWPHACAVNSGLMCSVDDNYRVLVGDLCYVAIGQIVNRRYWLIRYQPTCSIVINSPVYSAEIAKAIQIDWGQFDTQQHRHLLLKDLSSEDSVRSAGAKARLRYYFPN